jgi:hypothetical protein
VWEKIASANAGADVERGSPFPRVGHAPGADHRPARHTQQHGTQQRAHRAQQLQRRQTASDDQHVYTLSHGSIEAGGNFFNMQGKMCVGCVCGGTPWGLQAADSVSGWMVGCM